MFGFGKSNRLERAAKRAAEKMAYETHMIEMRRQDDLMSDLYLVTSYAQTSDEKLKGVAIALRDYIRIAGGFGRVVRAPSPPPEITNAIKAANVRYAEWQGESIKRLKIATANAIG